MLGIIPHNFPFPEFTPKTRADVLHTCIKINLNVSADLQTMQLYEPNLYRACMNVFGESYRLMDEFHCRKKKCLPEPLQYTLDAEKEE